MTRTVKINGYRFSIDCGDSRGTLCGDVVDPKSYKDCAIFSKRSNSCCFYRYKYKNPDDEEWQEERNCVWLGTGDIGEMSYKKLSIICRGNYLRFKLVILLIIILFIM